MSYTINHYNGKPIGNGLTVAPGTIDNSLDITLIGKNYAGYGQAQNENFIYLLENFANGTQPTNPLAGQIWFDTTKNKLRFYDGSRFRTAGSAESTPFNQPPSGLSIGDFWFDTTNKQLNVYNGDPVNSFTPIGPFTTSTNSGTTQFSIKSLQEQGSNTSHNVIESVIDGSNVIFTVSNANFTLNTITSVTSGFTDVKQGITLNSTTQTNGVWSSTGYKFWGTATNSDALGEISSSNYVRGDIPSTFSNLVTFSDSGINLGTSLSITNPQYTFGTGQPQTTPVITSNIDGIPIVFRTTSGAAKIITLQLLGNIVYPGAADLTDIGSTSARFRAIHASNTSIQSADLAEKYLADNEYEVGTVVTVGGEKEITSCGKDDKAIGVVSGNPGIKMNDDLEGGTYVALKGRVPVKIYGAITKGSRVKPYGSGWGKAVAQPDPDVFAMALESNSDAGVKLVECVIL